MTEQAGHDMLDMNTLMVYSDAYIVQPIVGFRFQIVINCILLARNTEHINQENYQITFIVEVSLMEQRIRLVDWIVHGMYGNQLHREPSSDDEDRYLEAPFPPREEE